MKLLEKLVLAALIGAGVLFLTEAWGIRPPARAFPLAIGIALVVMATLALVQTFLRPMTTPLFVPGGATLLGVSVAGLLAYVLVLPTVGYLPATAGFLFLGYVFLLGRRDLRSLLLALVIAIVATGLIWLCFAYWLGVNLPRTVNSPIPWLGARRF